MRTDDMNYNTGEITMEYQHQAWVKCIVVLLYLSGLWGEALAATTVPYTFSANTPAKASEVNANFQALSTAIDSTAASVANITGSNVSFSQNITVGSNASIAGNLNVDGQSTIRIINLSGAPVAASSANAGQLYFDTTKNQLVFSDGTSWRSASSNRNYNYVSSAIAETATASGPVASRILTLNKVSGSTKLKITYTDVFGTYVSSPGSTVAWNVYIDGQPIATPHALKSTVFSAATGWNFMAGNIKGYATGVSQGAHTVQIYLTVNGSVTQIMTGWEASFLLEVEEVD